MPAVTKRTLTHTLEIIRGDLSPSVTIRAGLVLSSGAAAGDAAEAIDYGALTVSVRKRSNGTWVPVTLAGLIDHRIIQECPPVGGFPAIAGTWRNFLVFGQSNASGRATVANLPSPWPPTATAGAMYSLGREFTFVPLVEPADADPTYPVDTADDEGATPVGAGFVSAFADRLLSEVPSIDNVGVAIVAKGAQVIADFAQNTSRNTLYGQALARCKALVRRTGRPIDGVIWYQGESDAQAGDPTTWAASVQTVFDALRTDLGSTYARADLPILVCRSPATVPNTFNSTWWATLRAQQAALAAGSAPVQIVVDVPTPVVLNAQDLHLETASVLDMGEALADAWIASEEP